MVDLCYGAKTVTHYEKKEGGFNRIFIFTCDNGERLVARIPIRVVGPRRLVTNSEVATIKYSRLDRPTSVLLLMPHR